MPTIKSLFELAASAVPNEDLCRIRHDFLIDRCRDVWRQTAPRLPRHTADCNNTDLDVSIEKTCDGWRWRYLYSVPESQWAEFFDQEPLREDSPKDFAVHRDFHETLGFYLENRVILIREVYLKGSTTRGNCKYPEGMSQYMNYISNDADPILIAFCL